MADRISFAVTATPIETLADENSGSHDVLSGEVNTKLGGGGDSLSLASYAQTAANQGFLNAAVNYSTASYAAGGTKLTALATADFIFIKNTGRKFIEATSLGAASTDVVIVALKSSAWTTGAQGGWVNDSNAAISQFFEIAWLQPGQAIVLPLGASNKSVTQFGSVAEDLCSFGQVGTSGTVEIYVKTVVAAGTVSTTSNAVQYLCVT